MHTQQTQMDQNLFDAGGSNTSTLLTSTAASSPTSLDDGKPTGIFSGSVTGEILTEEPRSTSSLSLNSTLVPKELVPLAPSNNPRYADINFIGEKIEAIDEGPQTSSPDPLPSQWRAYIHPEGKPYYHDQARNLATYANMRDPTISDQVENAFQKLSATKVALVPHHELVIEISEDGWCYYFADHKKLSIFWARKVEAPELDVEVFNSKVQRDLWLQKEYWHHLHNFPFHNDLPKDSASQLMDALLYGGVDHASSQTSMFSFTDAQRETYLSALRTYKKDEEGSCKGHRNSTTARIWSLLAEARFLSHHGHEAARIDRSQRIGVVGKDSRILRCLQALTRILLFNTPNAHHLHLKRLWLGRIVLSEHWQRFAKELLDEWSETTLLATVLLAADVSFWSVSDLQSWAALSIWISAVFALGSIVTALLQSRQHRGRVLAPALDVATYMSRVETKTLALLPLAITYALPYCLLMWSITWFGVGMVTFAVQTFWELRVGKVAIIYMAVIGTLPIIFSALFAWNIRLRRPSVAGWLPEAGAFPWPLASARGSFTQAGSEDMQAGQPPRMKTSLTRRLTAFLGASVRAGTTNDVEMQRGVAQP
ncbi:hypothetical protein BOTBODRAFT_185031 [Botryobasidium botryosum FD-172 SS1]|uniref:WW domain-containing protein n=1 Tax=Botryobasidium botryosum (strain FD-172 SS1) TaxID=930990 RepID=A0A067MUN1_BOTB1|nr:hypothetical protein BOTBODRAFT_185031 [Botryobasidium botryosum FD-172 SS1]